MIDDRRIPRRPLLPEGHEPPRWAEPYAPREWQGPELLRKQAVAQEAERQRMERLYLFDQREARTW